MLARRSRLVLDDWECDLPLLVPSFSSKGAEFAEQRDGRWQSDVAGDLLDFGHRGTKAVLVSAYDLHFGHLDLTEPLSGNTESALHSLSQAALVFLDSGGYEMSTSFDSCEPKVAQHVPRDGYDEAAYRRVITRLANDRRFPQIVLTSFDHGSRGLAVTEQLKKAKGLFADFNDHLTSFLLKPWGTHTIVDPDDLTEKDVGSLRAFDIVGVTEKDLGLNLWDRLKRIACLRERLNKVKVHAPLHIWGGLDPVITPLYFFAGAQLFDGVSWLRYGYINGIAGSKDSYQVLADGLGITQNRVLARGWMTLHNRVMLDKLSLALQNWVDLEGKEFDMFDPAVRDSLMNAYVQMKTQIQGV